MPVVRIEVQRKSGGLLPIDDLFIDNRAAASALTTYLIDRKRVTAIIAANDLMAIGVMKSLLRNGLSVPRDISVAGFDDIMASALVTPGLTTVAQFQDRLGARAAEKLLCRLSGETGSAQPEEMPFELVIRASVAPPPAMQDSFIAKGEQI